MSRQWSIARFAMQYRVYRDTVDGVSVMIIIEARKCAKSRLRFQYYFTYIFILCTSSANLFNFSTSHFPSESQNSVENVFSSCLCFPFYWVLLAFYAKYLFNSTSSSHLFLPRLFARNLVYLFAIIKYHPMLCKSANTIGVAQEKEKIFNYILALSNGLRKYKRIKYFLHELRLKQCKCLFLLHEFEVENLMLNKYDCYESSLVLSTIHVQWFNIEDLNSSFISTQK